MKQKFILYINSFLDFCKKSWRINKPMCILLILIIVIAVFFLASLLRNNVEKAANQLMLTAENIRHVYQTKPNYWGLNNQSALENGVFNHLRVLNNIPYNALGEKVMVGSGPLGETVMPGVNGFDITFSNVSFEQCVKLLTFPFSQTQNFGLQQILLFDSAHNIMTEFSWGGENPLPVSQKNAELYCTKINNLLWHFE